jgi:prepilin-type N-terminal cleavage/methylation domain-containing protein
MNMLEEKNMRMESPFNKKGITLIELLVALVISGIVIAGIYRLFVVQSRAYTVQDQVAEVQQNIRTTMEILLRDLRMTGYDNDSLSSKVNVVNPIIIGDGSKFNPIIVEYEYDDTTRYTVSYWVEGAPPILKRQLTRTKDDGSSTTETADLLENVDTFNLTYGIDTNDDGGVESWVPAGGVGMSKVVAVRVTLTGKPDQTKPDVKDWVSPRTLTSAVTLRNQCF